MATAQELADAALRLARDFLAGHRAELAAFAANDTKTLLQAARLLRSEPEQRSARERGDEHIAFTLLSAAFGEAAQLRWLEAGGSSAPSAQRE